MNLKSYEVAIRANGSQCKWQRIQGVLVRLLSKTQNEINVLRLLPLGPAVVWGASDSLFLLGCCGRVFWAGRNCRLGLLLAGSGLSSTNCPTVLSLAGLCSSLSRMSTIRNVLGPVACTAIGPISRMFLFPPCSEITEPDWDNQLNHLLTHTICHSYFQ